MKSHFLITFKTDEVDENGLDNFDFMVTKRKFANAKAAREMLTKPIKCGGKTKLTISMFDNEKIVDITPCSKDWIK